MMDGGVTPSGANGTGVVVIGAGYWGRNLVRVLYDVGALRAIVDSALDDDAFPGVGVPVHHGDDLGQVLARPSIDAAVIATPAATHGVIARRCLEAGKHCFVEKPLSLNLTEAKALVDLAKARGLVLMVGHLLQYHAAFQRLRAVVTEGELGRIQYVYSNRLNLGKFRREENALWSFAPHDISMILSLVGEEPRDVSATGSTYLRPGVADVTTTQLSFPGGAHAHVFVSWLHPVKEQRLVVVGDRGMAVFDDRQSWESKLVLYRHEVSWREGSPEPIPAEGEAVVLEPSEPLRQECRHFLDMIATGGTPITDGAEGVRVLRVLDAAQRSLNSGGSPVDLAARGQDTVRIHESAYIDDDVKIGDGTTVWHFSHVLAGSIIGKECLLGQNVVVGPNVRIGDRCRIQNNVSIYEGVTLDEAVFCGPSCVFTNVVNPRAEVSRRDEYRPTQVGRGATIGANATIVCGHDIGAYAFIAAGAVVTSDVVPHALMMGVPARRVGWMSHEGERLNDDLICPRSGRAYCEADGRLMEISNIPNGAAR
jgi:predicted dehydrogenase/acetyltransferase-like isoleucine patch superfamily enzyme